MLVPLPTFWMIWLKLIRLAGSRMLPTMGAALELGATEEPGIGTPGSLVEKTLLLRPMPTNLLLYFANQSAPNSSLLLSVNWPITVLNDTCGALTSISSRIFSTFITTSRLPRTMIELARWSAISFELPMVTAFGAVSTG